MGRGRDGAYYTTLHLALHIYRSHPCPVSVRTSRWGASIRTPYPLPLSLEDPWPLFILYRGICPHGSGAEIKEEEESSPFKGLEKGDG
jgi:hypothetical protein